MRIKDAFILSAGLGSRMGELEKKNTKTSFSNL